MSPSQFISRWQSNKLTERAGAQPHFDDLCELLGVEKPRDPDNYCFERGAKKAGGGDGWADVWKRGYFAWENKKPGRDLDKALKQLTDYSLQLESPPLLVVCDRERIIIHTAFTGYPDEPREIRIEELLDPAKRQLLTWVFTDPLKLRPAAFMQAVKVILTKRDISAQKKTDEKREVAIRQIINQAVVSENVVDIFDAVGLEKPNIGLLDDEFLAQVRNIPERNLAVELLERLLEGEIKSKFASNIVQQKKFSDMLGSVITRYQNRSIETAQVMEELVEMAKKFKDAVNRGEELGLNEDEIRFYDALATNESAVRELTDETLKKIAHELTENLRKNITVDWSKRESVRASLRLMVKRILRKYKYPPDMADAAVEVVLQQAEVLGEAWSDS